MSVRVALLALALLPAAAGANPTCCSDLDPRWQHMVDVGAPIWCAESGTDTDVAATCAAACAAACTPTQTVTVARQCPDVQPSCARLVRRYDRHGRVRSETCKRWATVSVTPVR